MEKIKNKYQSGADFLTALGATGNNIMINRYAMELVGPDAALILGELLAQWCLWKERNELDDDGYFFCTEEKLSKYTGWKYSK